MANPLVMVAIITGLFSLAGIVYANYAGKKRSELKATVTEIKAEALAKTEIVKNNNEAEANRINQNMGLQQKILDRQDSQIIHLNSRVDELTRDMKTCIDERGRFAVLDAEKTIQLKQLQALYDALEAQLKNVKEFQALDKKDKVIVDRRTS